MKVATTVTAAIAFGVDPDHSEPQIPLPIPSTRPTVPAPVESGPLPRSPLRDRPSYFLQAVVEVLAGERPARQLNGWLAEDVYRALEQRSRFLRPRLRTQAPIRRGRARVASVRIDMVQPGVAEVSGRFVHQGRHRAIAGRLELLRDFRDNPTWRCTALEWA